VTEKMVVRIEVGLDGGQILSTLVSAESAEQLERGLADGATGVVLLDAPEGAIQLVLSRVLYVKRFARESRVGFAE
jgi:hypothetical protein